MINRISAILIIALYLISGRVLGQDGSDPLLEMPIQASFQNQNLLEIFSDLESRYPIQFFYKEEWISREEKSIQESSIPLGKLLEELLEGSTLSFVRYGASSIIVGRRFDLADLSGFSYESFVENLGQIDQQTASSSIPSIVVGDSLMRPLPVEATINGSLYDRETEAPIIGARVVFPDLVTGTFTDTLGRFSITIPTGRHLVSLEAEGI